MEIPLTTPALLFPAIAILMLGYVNRYLGIAGVIRSFKKDYDSGYIHVDVVEQLKILKKRIELSRLMLTLGVVALMSACVSMFLIFADYAFGEAAFGLSIITMILSLFVSLYETSLSNKSLFIEIDDIFAKEQKSK
jgi:hypothetical protein